VGRMSQTRPGIADARQLAAAREPRLLPDFNVAARSTDHVRVRPGWPLDPSVGSVVDALMALDLRRASVFVKPENDHGLVLFRLGS
jgi:hypothetical protein